MNAFTTTYSGKIIPADPSLLADVSDSQFATEDIAHALSLQPRFNGHIDERYSVAEHSLLVADILLGQGHDPLTVYAGLMHDAHEAYIGDVAAPQKAFIPGFEDYERQFAYRVQRAHGLDPRDRDMWAAVRQADLHALALENKHLRVNTLEALIPTLPGFPEFVPYRYICARAAKVAFMNRAILLREQLQWI
jgi:5'-deoxynucleotidase YfbR-like HD superfamily hydrolase